MSESNSRISADCLAEDFSRIVALAADALCRPGHLQAIFFSVTRTSDELSVVCLAIRFLRVLRQKRDGAL